MSVGILKCSKSIILVIGVYNQNANEARWLQELCDAKKRIKCLRQSDLIYRKAMQQLLAFFLLSPQMQILL